MAAASAENVQNYTVLTPANKYQPKRTIAIAQAVLDPGGTVVTLYRLANDRVHLSKSVRIIVRGSPLTGLTDTAGTYLGGVNGQAGTDAELGRLDLKPGWLDAGERDRGSRASVPIARPGAVAAAPACSLRIPQVRVLDR